MPPLTRSFTSPITLAFTTAGIIDELANTSSSRALTSPLQPAEGKHHRPRATTAGLAAAMAVFHSRQQPENSSPRFFNGEWIVVDDDTWREMREEEYRGRKERRTKKLRAERRRGMGYQKRKKAFLGGKKGKCVEGGRRRFGKGEMRDDGNGGMVNVGGRFKARGA